MTRTFRSLALVVGLIVTAASWHPTVAMAAPQSSGQSNQTEHVRNGIQHFERAFFELLPKKQEADAAREFDLATAEFEAEVAARPSSGLAQSYLGRIFMLKKDYKKAASHYDKLSEIETHNVDAVVLAALAYAEDGQTSKARSRLEAAKLRTADPHSLALIDEYMSKLNTTKR